MPAQNRRFFGFTFVPWLVKGGRIGVSGRCVQAECGACDHCNVLQMFCCTAMVNELALAYKTYQNPQIRFICSQPQKDQRRLSMSNAEMFSKNILQTKGMVDMFLKDFSDADMFFRPAKTANHAIWQIGHLANSTRRTLFQGVIRAWLSHSKTTRDLARARLRSTTPLFFRTKRKFLVDSIRRWTSPRRGWRSSAMRISRSQRRNGCEISLRRLRMRLFCSRHIR